MIKKVFVLFLVLNSYVFARGTSLKNSRWPLWILQNLTSDEVISVNYCKGGVELAAVKDGRYFEIRVSNKDRIFSYMTESDDGRSLILRYEKNDGINVNMFFSLYDFFVIDEIDYVWEVCHGLRYVRSENGSVIEETFFNPNDITFRNVFWRSGQKYYEPEMFVIRRCVLGNEDYIALKDYTSNKVFWESKKEDVLHVSAEGKKTLINKGGKS